VGARITGAGGTWICARGVPTIGVSVTVGVWVIVGVFVRVGVIVGVCVGV
jgi:hypothetical protein